MITPEPNDAPPPPVGPAAPATEGDDEARGPASVGSRVIVWARRSVVLPIAPFVVATIFRAALTPGGFWAAFSSVASVLGLLAAPELLFAAIITASALRAELRGQFNAKKAVVNLIATVEILVLPAIVFLNIGFYAIVAWLKSSLAREILIPEAPEAAVDLTEVGLEALEGVRSAPLLEVIEVAQLEGLMQTLGVCSLVVVLSAPLLVAFVYDRRPTRHWSLETARAPTTR